MKQFLTVVCLFLGACATPPIDKDHDGLPDIYDACKHTPLNARVDKYGCALDSDIDGVIDMYDKCPTTSIMDIVAANGCKTTKKIN